MWAAAILASSWTDWIFMSKTRNLEYYHHQEKSQADANARIASPYVRYSIIDAIAPLTAHSIRQYYNRLLRSIGIRSEPKRRHEFSVNGFRKYFKTIAEQSGMSSINVEILMGHSVGLSDSYYRPTEQSLREDYLKAVDKDTKTIS